MTMRAILLSFAILASLSPTIHADVEPKAIVDADGVLVHRVQSEYQAGPTEIRVLLPDRLEKGKRYPVVFVLPVEAGRGKAFGNGLAEIKKLNLHNRFNVICVEVTFSQLPWYADHPTDKTIRQEAYFIKVVLPFIDKQYPTTTARWLLGFSKSGWGAFALLLRHPDLFARAVAWDAPLMMAMPNRFGMAPIFGSQANFEKYQLSRLFAARAKELGTKPRLAILGYANFREHHVEAHALLTRLGIPHEYRDEKKAPHTWHSGWVADGMKWLADGREDAK